MFEGLRVGAIERDRLAKFVHQPGHGFELDTALPISPIPLIAADAVAEDLLVGQVGDLLKEEDGHGLLAAVVHVEGCRAEQGADGVDDVGYVCGCELLEEFLGLFVVCERVVN